MANGIFPSLSELCHWWRVARKFSPASEAFWVALLHDTVEDGYLPRALLRWPALDAVTRRDGETYADFITRAAAHPVGSAVKVSDLIDNLTRGQGPRESLKRRYIKALIYLLGLDAVEGQDTWRDRTKAALRIGSDLATENQKLREALKPFAKAGELFADQYPLGSPTWVSIYQCDAGEEYCLDSRHLVAALGAMAELVEAPKESE